MADGALTITFADDTLAALAEQAGTAGLTPHQLAALLIEERLAERWTWVGEDPGIVASVTPGIGDPLYELNEVMDEFDAELERRLAARA